MPYGLYSRTLATTVVKDVGELDPPTDFHYAEIQADGDVIRYTMDDSTNPTASIGHRLLASDEPILVSSTDMRRMRFVRETTDAWMNVHWLRGRLIVTDTDQYIITQDGDYLVTAAGDRLVYV